MPRIVIFVNQGTVAWEYIKDAINRNACLHNIEMEYKSMYIWIILHLDNGDCIPLMKERAANIEPQIGLSRVRPRNYEPRIYSDVSPSLLSSRTEDIVIKIVGWSPKKELETKITIARGVTFDRHKFGNVSRMVNLLAHHLASAEKLIRYELDGTPFVNVMFNMGVIKSYTFE
jgi:hypothetical protein